MTRKDVSTPANPPSPDGAAAVAERALVMERLVDAGLRLHVLRREVELHDFLIEDLAELLRARRVLLVLEPVAGQAPDQTERRLVASLLPRGELAAALLQAVTPWLDEACRSRAVQLRHGPAGAPAIDQRSCLVAPLVAGQQVLGYLYADVEGLFGRFHDGDRKLLAALASQAAVALANLRTSEGLEAKVAECTAAAEQRAGELALINRIQQGMAAKLGFQDIVSLNSVGFIAVGAYGRFEIALGQ